MLPSNTRDALKAEIAAHLLKKGSKGWGEVRRLYPQVSESTFFRYVADAKEAQASAPSENIDVIPKNGLAAPCEIPHPDPERITSPRLFEVLPAADMIGKLKQAIADADALRAYALDSEGNVRRPDTLAKSIEMRRRLIDLELRATEAIYDLTYQQRFYDAVTDVVVNNLPADLQETVIRKLWALNQKATNSAPPSRN